MRSRYGRGTVEVRSRNGRGTVAVRSRCGSGTVEVLSRFGRGAARHSMVAVQVRYSLGIYTPGSPVVRYTQGSFPPGILDAPRTWLSWIRFGHRYYTLRNVLYSIYGLADSDRDNKLSVILIHYYTVDLGGHQGGAKDHAGLHWCGRGTARGAVEVRLVVPSRYTVRSWCGRGTLVVRSWCGRGTLVVRSRYARGAVEVRSWYGRGTLVVRSRYACGALPVRFRFGAVR